MSVKGEEARGDGSKEEEGRRKKEEKRREKAKGQDDSRRESEPIQEGIWRMVGIIRK